MLVRKIAPLYDAAMELYDAFISHAGEDKEEVVRPLADALRHARVEVWYDEYSVDVGDSLRQSIDEGLSRSRFGIVVLSPAFFGKQWPEWELNGLVQIQNSSRQARILPVWHNLSVEDVRGYSPSLADLQAVTTTVGLDEVVRRLLRRIRPQGSTLIVARDLLLDLGYQPPVVTDDWWLDVVSVASSNDVEGTFQEPMGWGRWGFPLPEDGKDPASRGLRLGWAAAQMMWQQAADELPITQITHPTDVIAFVHSRPGLQETCADYLPYLLTYAPLLGIRGFGGPFEDEIEAMWNRAAEKCPEFLALRDPKRSGFWAEPAYVACEFVQGAIHGPSPRYYEPIDYIAWLLSESSRWMPEDGHHLLLQGMKEWNVWTWHRAENRFLREFGFEAIPATGELFDWLSESETYANASGLPRGARRDLEHRLALSARLLPLDETGEDLAEQFLSEGFLEEYLGADDRRRRRRAEP